VGWTKSSIFAFADCVEVIHVISQTPGTMPPVTYIRPGNGAVIGAVISTNADASPEVEIGNGLPMKRLPREWNRHPMPFE
jgi:hypothetical protein